MPCLNKLFLCRRFSYRVNRVPGAGLAGVDRGDLRRGDGLHGVVQVDYHGDAVVCEGGLGQRGQLVILERAAGHADVYLALGYVLDARGGTREGDFDVNVGVERGVTFLQRLNDLCNRCGTRQRELAAQTGGGVLGSGNSLGAVRSGRRYRRWRSHRRARRRWPDPEC